MKFFALLSFALIFWTPPVEAQSFYNITLPLIFNQREVATLKCRVSTTGPVKIHRKDFESLLKKVLDKEFWAKNFAEKTSVPTKSTAPLKDQYLDLTHWRHLGIDIRYDSENLLLILHIPIQKRRQQVIRTSSRSRRLDNDLIQPSPFSLGTDLTFTQEFLNDSANDELRTRQPLSGVAEGFLRFGRQHPVYLSYDLSYLEADGWERSQTNIFYDNTQAALRYALGDLSPQTIGFQEPLLIGGLSYERLYNEIQPFRRTLPSGRSKLTLDQLSEVAVFVNGHQVRKLVLAPGRYDLRDLALADGKNRIQVHITDASGRKQVLNYDFFSDTQLLAADLSRFSLSAGIVRRVEDQRVLYDGAQVASGFYERGLQRGLTASVYAQASDRDSALAGFRYIHATSWGLFAADFAASELSLAHHYAAELSYSFSENARTQAQEGPTPWFRNQRLDIVWSKKAPRYTDFLLTNQPQVIDWELSLRYRSRLAQNYVFSFTGEQRERYDSSPSEQQLIFGLSKGFGQTLTTLTLSLRGRGGDFTEQDLFLSLNIPLGGRHILRSTARTEQSSLTTEWSRRQSPGVDRYASRLLASRSERENQLTSELSFRSNRFFIEADHDYTERKNSPGTLNETRLTGSFGLAVAGRRWSIGRETLPGFVLFDRHKSLANNPVSIQGPGRAIEEGYSDWLGAPVVPIFRSYSDQQFNIDVGDLPPGYSLENSTITLKPGAFTGYAHRIGQNTNVTAIGRIVTSSGEPLSYIAGQLTPLDDPTAPPVDFFTNKTGRIVINALKAGSYRVNLIDRDQPIGQITIPDHVIGLYNIGVLRIPE